MKKTIYTLLFCAAVLTSCTKFLDIKPYGEVIPKTADEFSSLLNSILEQIDYGEPVLIGYPSSVVDIECYSDNFETNLTSYPSGNFMALYIAISIDELKSGNFRGFRSLGRLSNSLTCKTLGT